MCKTNNGLSYDLSELDIISRKIEELEAIIQCSYDGIWVTDSQGKTILINKAYERLNNIKAEDVLGQNVKDLVKKGYYTESVALEVIRKKTVVTRIEKAKDGRTILKTGSPIFHKDGGFMGVVVNSRDMSELVSLKKKLEETEKCLEYYREYFGGFKNTGVLHPHYVGHSKAALKTIELADRIAQVDTLVLLLGETGVGKGVLARYIHEQSKRKKSPFFKINCGAIPETLLEAELFGYEPGSFTDARKTGKQGIFEMAHNGTLFLDEIGELPCHLQPKLLAVLEDGEVRRIGGSKQIKVDVRIIAATNRNLQGMVKDGLFRRDLYYRLNIFPITVPPLRDRKEDIPLLIGYFTRKFNSLYTMDKRFTVEATNLLQHSDYSWPGNIRELEHLIERLMLIVNEHEIGVEHLPQEFTSPISSIHIKLNENDIVPLKQAVENIEKSLIQKAVASYGSIRKAARVLEVTHSTIVKKMKKYELQSRETE